MKKIIPLIFSVFYLADINAQAVGGWGNCEFATVATMNAFDPSTNAFDCKKVFVQSTNEHYHWDGTNWVLDTDGPNIYNTDGTLLENRTVTMDGYNLVWDGASTGDVIIEGDGDVGIGTLVPAQKLHVAGDDNKVQIGTEAGSAGGKLRVDISDSETSRQGIKTMVLQEDGTNYAINGTAAGVGATRNTALYGWASGGTENFGLWIDSGFGIFDNAVGIGTTSPNAMLEVDGGNVRLSDYGTPATYDDATPLKILGVQADGDVVQTLLASIVGTDDQTASEVAFTPYSTISSTNVQAAIQELLDESNSTNIYTDNGSLDEDRTVDLDGNDLTFEGTRDVVIQADGDVGIGTTPNQDFDVDGVSLFRNGNNNNAFSKDQLQFSWNSNSTYRHAVKTRHNSGNDVGNSMDFYLWEQGVNTSSEIGTEHVMTLDGNNNGSVGIGTTSPQAKLEVDGGNVRLSDYGTPTTYDDASPLKILGVQADGDVVQTLLASIVGTDDQTASEVAFTPYSTLSSTNVQAAIQELLDESSSSSSNIYNADGTLDGDRTVEMDGNSLTFEGSGDVIIQDDAKVGIGTTNPGAQLEVEINRNQSFTVAQPDDGTNTFLSSIVAINTNSGNWSRALTSLTPNIVDGNKSGLLTFGQGDAARQAGHMYFVDTGSDGDEYIGFGIRNGSADFFNLTGGGDVGIGTTAPAAKLDVDGGSVRLSDYGTPTTYDDASPLKILGVQADGDVVQTLLASIVGTDDQTASEVAFTPYSTLSSTNVQSAIQELLDESSSSNIYTANGTLSGNRTVTMGTNDLTFESGSGSNFIIDGFTGSTFNNPIFQLDRNAGRDFRFYHKDDNNSGYWTIGTNDAIAIEVDNTDGSGIYVESTGQVGVGTSTPDAKFDVEGGTVRFSDYGAGSNTGTTTQVLGVDTDGDVVEMNTVASSRVFYPPSVAIPAGTAGTGFTFDLHGAYKNLFDNPAVSSPSAAADVPSYDAAELDYYVLDYDTSVFLVTGVSDAGIMTFNVVDVPTDNCSYMNIVFVVR